MFYIRSTSGRDIVVHFSIFRIKYRRPGTPNPREYIKITLYLTSYNLNMYSVFYKL